MRTYAELGGDELVSTLVMVGKTADQLHETQQVRFHHHIIPLISILMRRFLILDSLYFLRHKYMII